ncbi:MAG TPA: trigger factor [Clostridiales bacterium]|nr:trigger factor [Clostridiales bacterium]
MSLKVDILEGSMAKLTIEASPEKLEEELEKAYQKNKNSISLQGFRKGKVPRALVEKMYGPDIFYEDAANAIIPSAYEEAMKESELDIVSMPEIDVVQIEKGKPFIFTAEVAIKPEVTLGEYKGLEVETSKISISEEEVKAELDKVVEQNARMINVDDRPVEEGDITSIDFDGYVDGEQFEGGKAENYSLTIGSKSFIDGFEEQLIGKNVGEEVEVNVTFPEQYQAEELQGKDALFKVKINEIKEKELPELDDELAKDVSEFDTLEEYKEDIKKGLLEEKEKNAKRIKEDKVVDLIIDNTEIDIPEAMIKTQARQILDEFGQRMQYQGISIEQYYQFTGTNEAQLLEQMNPQAVKRIQTRLVLEEIVKVEDIKVSEEEFATEFEKLAETYQMELDKINEMIGESEKEQMRLDISVQKAIDLVVEASVEVEVVEEVEITEEQETKEEDK